MEGGSRRCDRFAPLSDHSTSRGATSEATHRSGSGEGTHRSGSGEATHRSTLSSSATPDDHGGSRSGKSGSGRGGSDDSGHGSYHG